MNTPQILFELSQKNPVVNRFLHAWMAGQVEYYEMLQLLAEELEKVCHRTVEKHDMKSEITKASMLSLSFPVLEKSLIPVFDEKTSLLKKQSELIEAIAQIHLIYEVLQKRAVQKIDFSFPRVVVSNKIADGFNLVDIKPGI